MNFLRQATDLAKEILKITSSLSLTGQPKLAEKETDEYTSLLERRKPMIEKLNQLIKQASPGDKAGKEAFDKIIAEILVLDKEQQRIIKHLSNETAASLKEARGGKKLNQAYFMPYDDLRAGRLDAKQ